MRCVRPAEWIRLTAVRVGLTALSNCLTAAWVHPTVFWVCLTAAWGFLIGVWDCLTAVRVRLTPFWACLAVLSGFLTPAWVCLTPGVGLPDRTVGLPDPSMGLPKGQRRNKSVQIVIDEIKVRGWISPRSRSRSVSNECVER